MAANDKEKEPEEEEVNLVELIAGAVVPTRQNNWVVMEKLGEGGFGAVYKVHNEKDQSKVYAMKTEMRSEEEVLVLKLEVEVLKKMEAIKSQHFCRIVGRGRTEQYNFIVMTCVGKSLSDLRKKMKGQKFSLSSTIRTALQALESLEHLHSIDFLHRDIKPGNFACGREEDNDHRNIYVLDFGMCRKYRTSRGELRFPRQQCEFRGTVRYASLNCHIGKEMSRKDDLEVWLYMTVEILRGSLPWKNKSDRKEVQKAKEAIRKKEELSKFLDECPPEFHKIFSYIETIQYWDKPDYDYCKHMLERVMSNRSIKWSELYDWEKVASDQLESNKGKPLSTRQKKVKVSETRQAASSKQKLALPPPSNTAT